MEFKLNYFKSRKMMLWKCCTQYTSKFGNLSSGHRPGKGQFSFYSQRRAMSKNVQTTAQLHSFHMLARLCSKSFKLGFNSTWTENFQMYKLAEEPEIKLPTFVGSWRKQWSSRKIPTSASLAPLTLFTVWITTNWKILKEIGIPDHLTCLLTGSKLGKEYICGCILSPCLFN